MVLYGLKSYRAPRHLHCSRIGCGLHDTTCRAGRYPGNTGFILPDYASNSGITRLTGTRFIAPAKPFDTGITRFSGTGCRMHSRCRLRPGRVLSPVQLHCSNFTTAL